MLVTVCASKIIIALYVLSEEHGVSEECGRVTQNGYVIFILAILGTCDSLF